MVSPQRLRRLLIATLLLASSASADSLVEQWKQGLSGARLTAYSGSAISSNSTLTQINFCRNGRYIYSREGSWSAPGAASGSSSNRIRGLWDIVQKNGQVTLLYATDQGEQGGFVLFLQNDGRVKIGATVYTVEQGAAGC